MLNTELERIIKETCRPYFGYYRYNNQQRPAFCFDSGHREGDVSGLEIILSPAGRTKKRVLTYSYVSTHAIQLIQHEGDLSIYEAESKLFKRLVSEGAVDVITKPVKPDPKQELLPAFLMMAYFLLEDCCEDFC
jgi:hypothetical protein